MDGRTQPAGAIVAKVFYQGLLRRVVGKSDEVLVLPFESNLAALFLLLIQRYGREFERALLTPAGELRTEVGILVDGLNPTRRGGLAYPLGREDQCSIEIALLGSPPVGG